MLVRVRWLTSSIYDPALVWAISLGITGAALSVATTASSATSASSSVRIGGAPAQRSRAAAGRQALRRRMQAGNSTGYAMNDSTTNGSG